MKFARAFRVVLAVLSSTFAGVAPAQLLNESWRDFADPTGTYTRGPAFIKNGRVVVARSTTTRELVAYDAFGSVVWRYAFPYEVLAMRATTDNFLYVTFNGAQRGVLALDQDGGFRWQLNESQYGNGVFSDNRIFGDSLLLCAAGRNLPIG